MLKCVQSLGQEDPLEGGVATQSRILAWTIPWTEKPGRLQSMGSHKVGHSCSPNTFTLLFQNISIEYIATISNSKFLRTSRLIYSLIKSTHFYLRLVFVLWLFPIFFSSGHGILESWESDLEGEVCGLQVEVSSEPLDSCPYMEKHWHNEILWCQSPVQYPIVCSQI